MSDELRNSLWNFIVSMFESSDGDWISAARWIAKYFRKVPVDELPHYDIRCRDWIKAYFFGLHWYEVYDLIEFFADSYMSILRYGPLNQEKIHTVCNKLFEREFSGYRFIAGVLAPISNPAETAEISSAIEITSRVGLSQSGPWIHLPDHKVTLTAAEEKQWQTIFPLLQADPFQPPRVRDIAHALSLDEGKVRLLLRRVARVGDVYLVAHDHYFTRQAIRQLSTIIREMAETHDGVSAAEFRDQVNTGRKLAIQILEFFNRIVYTRRTGDKHHLRQDVTTAGF
jgi:hypothetical protein